MQINNISYKTARFIENNKTAQKILRYADKNPSMTESLLVTGLALVVRPTAILGTNTDNDNKRYYISRSIISGILDLMTNALFFLPLQKYTQKTEERLIKEKGTVFHNNKEVCGSMKYIFNRSGKFCILPLQAGLLFWLIPRTVDKWFPIKKEKK